MASTQPEKSKKRRTNARSSYKKQTSDSTLDATQQKSDDKSASAQGIYLIAEQAS